MSGAKEIERLVIRCLVLGFDGYSLDNESARLVSAGAGGVILFRRNVVEADQVRDLNDSIHALSPSFTIISVDQEGGRVARLEGIATDMPPMRVIGSYGVEAARRVGEIMALELDSLGFDLALAPVADVDTNPDNPVIGDRAFSSDPVEVALLTSAFIEGLQGTGIAGCAKHFPGHGDTEKDSHHDLPSIAHERERLDAIELHPFARLAKLGVGSVMTAHVVVEKLDPAVPATLSAPVIRILREDMAYQGLILSDDMEMAAIADSYEIGDSVVAAIRAGCDQVLVCHQFEKQNMAVEALARAAMDDWRFRQRIEKSVDRIGRFAQRFRPDRVRPIPASVLRSEENLSYAADLSRLSTSSD